MQIGVVLSKEEQLGNALSKSLVDNRRADFAILLSMLSHDVLDFSEFHFPKDVVPETIKDEEYLKNALKVGPQQLLAPHKYDFLIGQDNAKLVQNNNMDTLRLNHCLNPEPLHIRDDKSHIPLTVLDNCELITREKVKRGDVAPQRAAVNAVAFYEQLAEGKLQNTLALST